MKKFSVLFTVGIALWGASCGPSNSSSNQQNAQTVEQAKESVPGVSDLPFSQQLVLEGNDQMKFDKSLFRVKVGDTLTMVFKNVGELPKASMGHNVVILAPGTDISSFGAAAVDAREQDYIPASHQSSIIAHTKLLGPGEEDTLTFVLQKAGVYPYICSFPGHYGLMQGKIVAE